MQKKVLAIYYTQTGQLGEIVDSFLSGFDKEIDLDVVRVYPEKDFQFPWNSETFFDAMPEAVLQIPVSLKPITFKHEKYDLIVLAYQPWYLSLSIPANSILQCPQLKKLWNNTPIVTLIGARNMWISSQEKLKKLLAGANANLVGNIALVDKHPNLTSAVTILHWMMNGEKTSYKGVFPKPGVSEEDIKAASYYGKVVSDHLLKGNLGGLQEELVSKHAVEIKPNLLFIEERAPRLFLIWANLIIKRKNRKVWLVAFKYYLLFALFIVAPVVLTINAIFFRPFFSARLKRKTKYYLGLESKI